jgi:small subunit ribosomal protein S17
MSAMAETQQSSAGSTDSKRGPTPKKQEERGPKRELVGRVISDTASAGRAKKTVTVEVVRRVRDAVYGKYVKTRKRYHAHDETEQFKTNDVVEIRESRPLSATKRWVAVRLVDRPEEV